MGENNSPSHWWETLKALINEFVQEGKDCATEMEAKRVKPGYEVRDKVQTRKWRMTDNGMKSVKTGEKLYAKTVYGERLPLYLRLMGVLLGNGDPFPSEETVIVYGVTVQTGPLRSWKVNEENSRSVLHAFGSALDSLENSTDAVSNRYLQYFRKVMESKGKTIVDVHGMIETAVCQFDVWQAEVAEENKTRRSKEPKEKALGEEGAI